MKTPIYLDYQASTPIDSRVLDAMMPYLTTKFGNPHSASHAFGWEANAGIEIARDQIADLIGCDEKEVTFASGATESNNHILRGVMERFKGKKTHLITVETEHSAVLEAAREAVRLVGGRLTILPVKSDGLIDLDTLKNAITEETALVSVMMVNNEIGVIQPIELIAKICHESDVLFHTDAAQAVGKIPVDVKALDVDYMSFTAHKFYGPKGIGATFSKRGKKRLVSPQMSGGEQQLGFRSGTLSPALCAGIGAAAALCKDELRHDGVQLKAKRDHFLTGIRAVHPEIIIHGSMEHRFVGNLNIAFPGLDGAVLSAELKQVAISSSSACSSTSNMPSRVLSALGMSDAIAQSSLRIGFGRMTTEEEVDFAISEINRIVTEMGGLRA